ncbi:MAG TPA: Fis family transcriptional regulator [Deltaproteobacteria bacterium]|nr:Fis family transcriptional regulator [Deltaproteobacteria bacterium]
MARVLVIDDDEMICEMIVSMVEDGGHDVECAGMMRQALHLLSKKSFDIVFLDIHMPDGNGLDFLPKIKELPDAPEVIIITGLGDPDGAEIAIKKGAWDYIQKSSSIKEMMLPFIRALQYREEKSRKPSMALKFNGVMGTSHRIKACLDLLAEAANSEANVLITGETGTGKEVFAQAIHQNSRRSGRNFVVVDCTSLPPTLVESVLLGYEKGAFTGAETSQEGLIRQANGGTLFLDEIGELPQTIQKAFLRVLQEHRFRPVGGKREVESDFRLVAATHQSLDAMVESGDFRMDLLFRLRTLSIDLPPLRERKEDIRELVIYHTVRLCERYGIGTKGFSPEFFGVLESYDWPGNVRELVNAIERAIAVAPLEPTLFPRHLPTDIRAKIARQSVTREPALKVADPQDEGGRLVSLEEYRETTERTYLQSLMASVRGNVREACQISGLSRSRLYALLKQYNIPALR